MRLSRFSVLLIVISFGLAPVADAASRHAPHPSSVRHAHHHHRAGWRRTHHSHLVGKGSGRTTHRAAVSTAVGATPFAASSPWNTPLPDAAPLDPSSRAIVAQLNSQVQYAYGHAALNTYSYSAPLYTVSAHQSTVNVRWNNCQGKSDEGPTFAAALQNVPIPAGAVASEGSDAEMVIYQPSTGTDWEFWDMTDSRGTWSACWGGKIQNVSSSPGVFTGGTGATASGLPLLGGLITLQDLRSGSIAHAIAVSVPAARQGAWSWPAQRSDGYEANPEAPAEGERLRFPASLNLSQFNLSPGELMIARAIQRYGMIVTDQSGAMSFQAQDPRPFETAGGADPYLGYFSGPQYSWLDQLPWQDLQTLAWNYGETAH